MKFLILTTISLITIVFYMLEISFKSFSRISLAGFLEDFEKETKRKFDFVKNYEMALNSLSGFAFFLQLCLFIYAYIILGEFIENPLHRVFLLIFVFLFLFNLFFYTISFVMKEGILKRLIFLFPVARVFFSPFNIVFSSFVKNKLHEKENDQDDISEKELETFVEVGTKEGVLEKEDKEMIVSVIEFGETLVKEIMTPRVDMIYVDIDVGMGELAKIINEKKKSRYPVISGRIDNIEGVILSKDVFGYWNEEDFNIKKILREPFFIPETMRILELLKELQKSKQKFAVVVDEFGGISGVVTMEDIIEEIVGEIHDEYDEDTEQIVKEEDYFIVKGDTDISELNDTLEIKLEEDEDYYTVAGLLSYKLGKIPKQKEKVTVDDHTFEVLETEKNRIKKVKIYPPAPREGEPVGNE
ncbi:MAG: HlyC/CorC family transporter [Candidatus Aminicenantes bacterium]|nr:HlyC/CorC family transporter [Candidatus Aminicenantes bacterium]